MGEAFDSETSRPQRTPAESIPNWPILILSLIGIGLTGYLTVVAWAEGYPAFCEAGADCEIVLSSDWAWLFGLPISFWGFLTYVTLAAITWVRRRDLRWKLGSATTLFGVVYSGYLIGVSILKLDAACLYCLTSAGLLTIILVVTLFQRPRDLSFGWKRWLTGSFAGAVVLTLGVHFAFYSGFAAMWQRQDPWMRGLAEHLDTVGAKFYGAFWCPNCQNQKRLFGASAARLPYVECNPEGRGHPQAAACESLKVRRYPTWIINGCRYTGDQTANALADYSGFEDRSEFTPGEESRSVRPEVIHLDELIQAILGQKKLVLVDVRPPDEYQHQHIEGSISMPLSELAEKLDAIPKDNLVVLYSACPPRPAFLAYQTLYAHGFRNMKILYSGLPGWIEKGYPVETDQSVVPPKSETPASG